MRRYASEHSERWEGFEHRPGDVVISTRTKCGTTWMQMICALLVFGEPELPAPLAEISPWLDWPVEPVDVVRARLGAQTHRRIIKTHTPLDGLPLDPRVTYIVVGRQPLDVAGSLFHHRRNIDRARFAELTRSEPDPEPSQRLDEWIGEWLDIDWSTDGGLDTLSGLIHHIDDARHRSGEFDVLLVHYQDLLDDTALQMRQLADRLGVEVDDDRWPALVEAASFPAMRAQAERTVPDHLGVLKSSDAFFRSGTSGEGRTRLDAAEVQHYRARTDELAAPDLLTWLERS